jgi:hypothetical protein
MNLHTVNTHKCTLLKQHKGMRTCYDVTGCNTNTIHFTPSPVVKPHAHSRPHAEQVQISSLSPLVCHRSAYFIWTYVLLRGRGYVRNLLNSNKCWAVSGLISSGSRNYLRKPASVTLCPPQTQNDLSRAGSQAAAVGGRRLTFWAMALHWTTNWSWL